jgi:hypothetical protein
MKLSGVAKQATRWAKKSSVVRWATAAALPAALLAGLSTPASAATTATVVSITFDNQWENQMTAAADLQAHGMAGTFYIISGWIGLSGFMSMSDLQTLVADGDEIGGKTVDNVDLLNMTNAGETAEAQREVCEGRDVLLADGFQVSDFAYPFADDDAADEAIVAGCGYNSGRTVGNVSSVQPGGCSPSDCPYAESIPPADPYAIATPDDTEQTTTLAELETNVTNAENNGGGWLVFSFHQICDTPATGCDPVYSWSPTLFDQFLTWLQTQSSVSVKTVAQVVGGAVQPAVTPPLAPVAGVGTQALVNPTLTTADPITPAGPECWAQEGYGTNTPTFTWSTTGGQGGGGQETIVMNNLSSGDAKLVTTFDLGQCSPTTVTGDTYQLGAYYQSTVPVFFTVYGRSSVGTWSYWTQSPMFPPTTGGWALASWLSPPVPSTVQAISFGLTIPSNGTLSTSDYSLVNQGSGVPPPAAVGVNALVNPLLANGSDNSPTCWSAAGYGTNTPSFTWSPTGGQTGGEETVTMSSWTNGDAKLVTTFDNGNCAPTVVVGSQYTISLYYQSTVPVFITLYSRSASNGSWGYWTQSPNFPATTGGWSEATWTTPAVPAGVNGASFGMTIASVGTLSTSNYSLVQDAS